MPVSALKKLAEEVYIMGVVVRGETGHGFKVGQEGGRGRDGSSQPVFLVDIISFMVNAVNHEGSGVFLMVNAGNHEEDAASPPQKCLDALRVLADHLHRDGLHLRVLLQAALSSGNRQREDVSLLLRLFM